MFLSWCWFLSIVFLRENLEGLQFVIQKPLSKPSKIQQILKQLPAVITGISLRYSKLVLEPVNRDLMCRRLGVKETIQSHAHCSTRMTRIRTRFQGYNLIACPENSSGLLVARSWAPECRRSLAHRTSLISANLIRDSALPLTRSVWVGSIASARFSTLYLM